MGANIYWQVETVAGSSVVDNITVHQPHTLYDGRFHHVAGTYDGAAMVIYVDGNHGTLVGNTMFAPGKAGQAFNFNRE